MFVGVGFVMSKWIECNLGELATLQRGFDLPSSNRKAGSIPIISSSGCSGKHDIAVVSAPGVVTGRYGTIGEIFYIEEDFWPLNTTLFVNNFHGNYPLFVYYLLQRVNLKKFSDKTGVPGINRNDIHKIKVLRPPIAEQDKIAEILGCWDEAIVTTEKLIAAKQKLKKALMQKLLTGKLRSSKFTAEHSWFEGRFCDAAEVIMGQSPDGSTYNQEGIGIPLLNGPTEFSQRYPVRIQWTSKYTKKCKKEDILLCVRGSSTGRINIADDVYCIGRGIAAIRAKSGESINSYLEHQLIYGVQKILALTAGSTFPNIDKIGLTH
jgi:type I restriction enzyme, S subunit